MTENAPLLEDTGEAPKVTKPPLTVIVAVPQVVAPAPTPPLQVVPPLADVVPKTPVADSTSVGEPKFVLMVKVLDCVPAAVGLKL